ncbi:hypothetical protein PSN45_002740 [Yamadazyma tenuis]|uniref:Survival protein SurE-like phosphatase/nucleotidase domain-containing protein n=1 Tax=Candida tenuis (strain ATCC 10573 / BCRC 21748 / CBS 615 / JCM 9827 / NBRC 10315 / NRRL Y-1498 / VKM Y-70) TaxID=590646 RepID=G3AWY6_CANTC|nr:uncharacterized protein CANTEDRAFT_112363 [Yamadazyma tenuis ATCC 10573]XP_006684117.1 uncharacterized protein CANTEDRAFT_112363 [Yamadazyma tenuis ATCC 10573]EGV66858.1 hypothetical protein CANTEDRAFT_112363 [Yamadazyma tenuis ATCC 10573]EGV66859.1 hypothetical protein CANTEDRAFT_112363 [Yamadazyma tenuis ATCC 10573]WEJ95227.1 hypothetical protein PSN45_002740 [Yamadazyma tenuis]
MKLILLPVLVLLVVQASGLNILLSTTDSWVTKNSRLLAHQLTQKNHTVVLVAPLHQSVGALHQNTHVSNHRITDGGDFGHLLPSNQLYYKNLLKLDKINLLPGAPRRLLKKEDLRRIEEEVDEEVGGGVSFVNTNQWGNDPLDKNCWYVNSNDPISILSVAVHNLLPQMYPGMKIDLAILGPTEGTTDDVQNVVTQMEKFLLVKEIPTISVHSKDSSHIYFKSDLVTKNRRSQFAKMTHYQNSKIIELVDRLQIDRPGTLMPKFHAINIKFPQYLKSNCKLASDFSLTQSNQLLSLSYNVFDVVDDELVNVNTTSLSLTSKDELAHKGGSHVDSGYEDFEEEETQFFINKESEYYKNKLKHSRSIPVKDRMRSINAADEVVFSMCDIPMSIDYLFELDPDFHL